MQAKFSRGQILNLVLIMEAALLLVATLWCWIAKIDLMPLLNLTNPAVLLVGIGMGVVMSGGSLVISLLASKFRERLPFLASFEDFVHQTLAPIFAKVNPLDILLISLASGFCEEIFFRGVLQTQFGMVIASLIFGMFHYAGRRYVFYVLWAALAGAALGLAMDLTHSIWVPICAHVVNNFLSITMVRYQIGYKPRPVNDDASEPADEPANNSDEH